MVEPTENTDLIIEVDGTEPNQRETTTSKDHTASVIKADGYAFEVRDKKTGATLARGWAINRWVARIAAHASVSGLEAHPERE